MIVREHEHDYVLIQQDHHAQISGYILEQWKSEYFLGPELRDSVEYAAYKHDYGWKEFDKQPFYNDKENKPFTFFDFPNLPKIILYKHGIDEVEKVDSYAAMLCSEHYKRFLLNNTSIEAQAFVIYEEIRQQAIVDTLNKFNKRLFEFHYSLLQLADNLSLYICMNEPGTSKQNEHPFFKEGIPTNTPLHQFCTQKLQLRWLNNHTIAINNFPFKGPITFNVKQKVVTKDSITNQGLIESYEEASLEELLITILPG
ncbi:DUF3891 family protein [Oceanobacillus rekensis]|uniref:DUF3891 family protein n=1 Tax=Oceanobacillus rekensis TaxID=937927 RepID=UPI000B43D2B3|nr:DUF3891 family protein [Oceanobacillus rekensis]